MPANKRMGQFTVDKWDLSNNRAKVHEIYRECNTAYTSDMDMRTMAVAVFATCPQFDEIGPEEEVPFYEWEEKDGSWTATRAENKK